MSRRRSRQLVVPGAEQGMADLKAKVMQAEGFTINPENPNDVKYEVAEELGVPLSHGYNGNLTTEQAGQVGGKIGGSMVREMIRIAQDKLSKQE